jgi:hypothetical protein
MKHGDSFVSAHFIWSGKLILDLSCTVGLLKERCKLPGWCNVQCSHSLCVLLYVQLLTRFHLFENSIL